MKHWIGIFPVFKRIDSLYTDKILQWVSDVVGSFTCSSERENTKMIFQAYEMEQRIVVLEWNCKRQVDKKNFNCSFDG